MDVRDFRIYLELERNPFASWEAIGRTIGMSGTAVKVRIDRMRSRGVISGVYVMPVAQVLGRHWQTFGIAAGSDGPDDAAILRADDVVWTWRDHRGLLVVNAFTEEEDAVPEGLIAMFGKAALVPTQPEPPITLDPASFVLSPLDWRILEVLIDRPRTPLSSMARQVGLSARTVRKRRDALYRRGLVRAFISLDASREPGEIVYGAYVSVDRRENLRKVRARGAARVWTHYNPPAALLMGHVPTYSAAAEAERQLQATPGAKGVMFSIPTGGSFAAERVREWIQAERRRWGLSGRTSGGRRRQPSTEGR